MPKSALLALMLLPFNSASAAKAFQREDWLYVNDAGWMPDEYIKGAAYADVGLGMRL